MSTTLRVSERVASVSPAAANKPILAERFKTKMCQNYETKGACPYEARCMFAHGEADLRTKEMNLADGLTTEEAVRTFNRAKMQADREKQQQQQQASKSPLKAGKSTAVPSAGLDTNTPLPVVRVLLPKLSAADVATPAKATPSVLSPANLTESPRLERPVTPMTPQTEVAGLLSPRSERSERTPKKATQYAAASPATPTPARRRYSHNPYAPVVIGGPATYDYVWGDVPCRCGACQPTAPVSALAAAMLSTKPKPFAEPCYCADCSASYHEEVTGDFAHNSTADQILLA